MNRCILGALAILLLSSLGPATASRILTVTAARFYDSSGWIDPTVPNGPMFGTLSDPWFSPQAEMALLCRSAWYPVTTWSILRHLPLVRTAQVWYYPLNYGMGEWPLEAGDQLICGLYECDGGCDPAKPAALPTADDDFVGEGMLAMADFKSGVYRQLSIARNGTDTATVQLECDACNDLWAAGSWFNPFQTPPANWSGPGTSSPVPSTLPALQPPSSSPANRPPPPSPPVVPLPPPSPPPKLLSPTPAPLPSPPPTPLSSPPLAPLSSPPPSPPPPTPLSSAPPSPPPPSPYLPAAAPGPEPEPAPAPEVSAFDGPSDSNELGSPTSAPPGQPPPSEPPPEPSSEAEATSTPQMQQQKGKGPPVALIAGVVAAAVLLVLLLLGVCAWRRWRRGRQTAQLPDDGGSSRQAEAGIRIPRIHADKPQQAAEAMRALNAPAAIVSTTWRPER